MPENKYAQVKALIITGVGLNCEKETAAAFTAAGATEIGRAHV